MPDVILPGIYITVRDEGLVTVAGVSTGNIGIVGIAVEGDTDKVYTLSSLTEAREIFGPNPDKTLSITHILIKRTAASI